MATAYKPVENDEDGGTGSRIQKDRLEEASRIIIGGLDSKARDCVRQRQPIEERWIRNIYAYLGVYEPGKLTQLIEADQSTAFVKLTRHKTDGWSARISDLLFPTDNKNWGVSPTPIPTLTGKAKEAAAAAVAKVAEANAAADAGDPSAEQIAAEAGEFAAQVRTHYSNIEEAKRRCEWMERTIEDQLVESDYVAECRDVIEDGCKLGTGILKGPTTIQSLRPKWSEVPVVIAGQPTGKTTWALQQDPDPRPMFKRVNPWFFYPDMSATNIKEAEFTFELSLPSRKDLKRSARKLGFNKEAVTRLLEEGPPHTPDSVLVHLAEVRAITGENEDIRNRYVQWEYNGPLECDDITAILRAMGRDEEAERFEKEKDPFEEYRVIVHFIGNEVLKIAPEYPLDSNDGLYSVWCFAKSEAGIFGLGVPEIMSDSQNSLNVAWRAMQDNGALSVGPQLVFDKGAVIPQDGAWGLKPLKIWLRSTTSYASPQNKPFDAFDIPNNQAELAGIIQLAKEFADEESAMPDIAQGEQGAASKTLGGMSMLFNSANVVFRRVVKSWDDDLTKPTLRRAYDWNMQFNPDDSIKGDMGVDARGTSVLLVREIQSQNLMAIVTNFPNNAPLAPYIKVRETLVKTFQTMMIPPEDVLHTQEEVDKKQAEAAQQQPQEDPAIAVKREIAQMQMAQAKAEIEARERMANLEYQVKTAQLEQTTGLTREELEAKYGVEHRKIDSSERMEAAKIAIEQTRENKGIDPGQGIG
jgi:hypothetical protein